MATAMAASATRAASAPKTTASATSRAATPSYSGLRPGALRDGRLFLSGAHLLRSPAQTRKTLSSTTVRMAGEDAEKLSALFDEPSDSSVSPIYGPPKAFDSLQGVVSGFSTPIMYGVGALLVAGGLGVGATVGGKAPENLKTVGQVGGAVAVGAAAGAGAYVLNEKRKTCAPVELQNLLGSRGANPTITVAEVDAIGEKFGANLRGDYGYELSILYDAYMQSVLPASDTPLEGDEHLKLLAFKNGLGLEDGDAAAVHIEAGRRIFRSRMEVSGREGQKAELKAFQKLVFVSTMVFGEAKSKFLLPWKRLFNVTDSQISIARRENAKQLYEKFMVNLPGDCEPDVDQLKSLREEQNTLGLEEEVAAECLRSATRARVESIVERASETVKARTRAKDATAVMTELNGLLKYNNEMAALADVEGVAAGVGPVTLFGGKFEGETSFSMRKELYKTYLTESIKEGKFEASTVEALSALSNTLMISSQEAEKVTADVTATTYRNQLRKAVQDGSLDAAESKAQYLQKLCDDLKFPPQTAAEVHADIYRTRLETNVEDKVLTDKDSEQLNRLRVLLCVPGDVVKKAHETICGAIYKDALLNAMSVGADAFSTMDRTAVKKSKEDVKLDSELAVNMLKNVGETSMMGYVTRARNAANRIDGAKELKKMLVFSHKVLTPLLEDAKPPKTEEEIAEEKKQAEARLEIEKLMKEATAAAEKEKEDEKKEAEAKAAAEAKEGEEKKEEGEEEKAEEEKEEEKAEEVKAEEKKEEEEVKEEDKPTVEEKVAKGAKEAEEEEAKAILAGATAGAMQKEITLANSLDMDDRKGIYKNFLLYCMTGDVKQLPMGGQIVVERDQSEFTRLSQLGDVLGLNQMDVADVHKGLSEQAFRSNVENVMRDGQMTKEKSEYLKDMQKQLGMGDADAQKIIQGITSQRMGATMSNQISQGTLTLQEIRDLKATGVDVESVVSKEVRSNLFRKEVETKVANGSGPYDVEEFVASSAEDLALEADRVKEVVAKVSKEKKRGSLVTAVSFLRQQDKDECFKQINNMLACHSGCPDVALEWTVQEEVQDIFSIYCSEEKDDGKIAELQKALGMPDDEASSLKEVVAGGGFNFGGAAAEEEEALF